MRFVRHEPRPWPGWEIYFKNAGVVEIINCISTPFPGIKACIPKPALHIPNGDLVATLLFVHFRHKKQWYNCMLYPRMTLNISHPYVVDCLLPIHTYRWNWNRRSSQHSQLNPAGVLAIFPPPCFFYRQSRLSVEETPVLLAYLFFPWSFYREKRCFSNYYFIAFYIFSKFLWKQIELQVTVSIDLV